MRTVLALCLAALSLAGCGAAAQDSAKDFKGAEGLVASTIEDLETAARDNKPEVVCGDLLSAQLLATLKQQGTNCDDAVTEAFKDADSVELKVDDVTISGTTATARITSGRGGQKKKDTLSLVKVGAGWKISSLRA